MSKLYIKVKIKNNEDIIISNIEAVVIYAYHVNVFRDGKEIEVFYANDYENIMITPE